MPRYLVSSDFKINDTIFHRYLDEEWVDGVVHLTSVPSRGPAKWFKSPKDALDFCMKWRIIEARVETANLDELAADLLANEGRKLVSMP